ncbi:MAG: carboxypeptidase-like regulatory domain-containing protein [Bacteroidetes bacterium]|nr:carboxypeptidase-like regulatory domain-containing protein [Fibrella sp.]
MTKYLTQRAVYLTILGICFTTLTFAQTRLAGRITDASTKDGLAGVSLAIKGKVAGTITDTKGNFALTTAVPTPFTVIVSSVGYQTQQLTITGDRPDLAIALNEQILLGQEVVVSGSRVPEEIMKSPVSVEKIDIRAIREAPAASFYDALANLKGVDLATQGVLFKSVNLRGFGATGNPRTVQLIDGMDNSAPGLNFPVDNIVGMPELDVESVEVLPGAASALYGPNAINGLILMSSKSPFLYQGLSANVKTGVMSASNRAVQNTGFYDASIRYAKAFNNKLAFKVNLAYIAAKDWEAANYTNLNIGGNPDPNRGLGTNPNYDGTNAYGDEAQANLRNIGQGLIAARLLPAGITASFFPNTNVSRTGYEERDLVDYNTKSFKFNGAVHYRLTDRIELIGQGNYGMATTVYTGTGRYSLRDFTLTQAKLELRGDNFTLRAYTTQERSGKSYLSGLAAIAINEEWKPSRTAWFPQFGGAFATAKATGQSDEQALVTARGIADQGRPLPGTAAYNTLLDKYRNLPISEGGGGFADKSNLYHAEGVYNFKNQVKVIDLLVGANVRQYQLRSAGTLFADLAEGREGSIAINEYGGFLQAGKSLFNDHLKLTGSLRYDKNQNFKGQFTPRVSAVTTFGEQNFRVSYQTGFRIPTTQNQFIDLQTPLARLIGGLPEFDRRYNLANSYTQGDVANLGVAINQSTTTTAVQQQAEALIRGQVTAAVTAAVNAAVAAGQIPAGAAAGAIQAGVAAQLPSALAANLANAATGVAILTNIGSLQPYQAKEFKPERVANYEVGYRGLIAKKLYVDAYYYYSVYTDFIGALVLLQPTASVPGLQNLATGVLTSDTRRVFSRPANSSEKINASGWAIGLNYQLGKGYTLGGNIANNTLNNFTRSAEIQYSSFNTPKYRYNVTLANRNVNNSKIGFSVNYKHQDEFLWESGFVQPSETTLPLFTNTMVPAINNIDAQVSYKLTSYKSIIKLGGTNLFGKPYIQAYGSPAVGSMYYVSLTFDELLN